MADVAFVVDIDERPHEGRVGVFLFGVDFLSPSTVFFAPSSGSISPAAWLSTSRHLNPVKAITAGTRHGALAATSMVRRVVSITSAW